MSETKQPIPMVYQAINDVAAALSTEGISKARRNQQQGYSFRGIDDVYNALAPILAAHQLVILPRVLSREVTERQTAKGGALFYVVIECEFDFVCSKDGSRHTVKTFGEAMDSADKATNKAMSAAYKYAAMQAFCIPTEGDNDADATTHDVAAKAKIGAVKPKPMSEQEVGDCINTMRKCDDLETLKGIFGGAYTRASDDQKQTLKAAYDVCKEVLESNQPA